MTAVMGLRRSRLLRQVPQSPPQAQALFYAQKLKQTINKLSCAGKWGGSSEKAGHSGQQPQEGSPPPAPQQGSSARPFPFISFSGETWQMRHLFFYFHCLGISVSD